MWRIKMDFNEVIKQYPYLSGKPIDYLYDPRSGDNRYLEAYPPGETGNPNDPRPKQLPINRYGIHVLSPNVTPLDILGDYVSHGAVKDDPILKKMYDEFQSTVPDSVMKERYKVHQQRYGEKRPFEEWLQTAGMPEYFRGYTFNQWNKPEEMYTQQQLQILDKIKEYVGVTKPSKIENLFYKDPFSAPDYSIE
jgi:hypothetical protein